MKRDYFYNVCASMKDKIMAVTKKEHVNNEELFNDIQ